VKTDLYLGAVVLFTFDNMMKIEFELMQNFACKYMTLTPCPQKDRLCFGHNFDEHKGIVFDFWQGYHLGDVQLR